MLACLVPVRKKPPGHGAFVEEGKKKVEPSKLDHAPFTCQFKQMAARLSGGSVSKYCKPGCASSSREDVQDEKPNVRPTPPEMHSPQFSLKSYNMNGIDRSIGSDQIPDLASHMGPPQASPRALRSLHQNFAEVAKDDTEAKPPPAVVTGLKGFSNEWVAQVEPGVYITFCSAPDGYNDLKRIKFSRAMFSKQHAESWWTENCLRVRTSYNVRPPSQTPTDDERLSSGYATPDAYSNISKSPSSTTYAYNGGDYLLTRRKSSADSRLKDSADPQSGEPTSNSWIELDEAGVYLTIVIIPGVGKQLKRVRFSREKFSEAEAAAWWETNRQRIYAQYIFTNTRLQSK